MASNRFQKARERLVVVKQTILDLKSDQITTQDRERLLGEVEILENNLRKPDYVGKPTKEIEVIERHIKAAQKAEGLRGSIQSLRTSAASGLAHPVGVINTVDTLAVAASAFRKSGQPTAEDSEPTPVVSLDDEAREAILSRAVPETIPKKKPFLSTLFWCCASEEEPEEDVRQPLLNPNRQSMTK